MLIRLAARPTCAPTAAGSPWSCSCSSSARSAMLYLPSLNADIIDNGVATGDTGYIVRTGRGDARRRAAADRAARSPPSGSARAPRWASAATSAPRSSTGSARFSAREVQQFGAPSLITRTTNDVQQVQMLVLMGCTMMVVRADHDGRRRRDGDARGLRPRPGCSPSSSRRCSSAVGLRGQPDGAQLPRDAGAHRRGQPASCASRSPASGWSARSSASPTRPSGSRDANDDLTDVAVRAGRWHGDDVPAGDADPERLHRRGALVRRPPGRRAAQMEIGALTAFLAYLMQILMSVMMATFMLMMVPRAAVCADRITEVLDTETSVAPPAAAGAPTVAERGDARSSTTSTFTYPGADVPVLARRLLRGAARADRRGHRLDRRRQDRRWSTWCRGSSTPPAGGCWSTGSTYATSTRTCSGRGSAWCPQRAYLFSGTVRQQPALRQARRHRRRAVAGARDRPGARLRRGDARGARRADRPGRHQRLAAASGSGWPSRGRWSARPEIYLFDDSFSALDLATDARLRAALRPVTRDATVLIVAQRVSTIRDADLILVLEDGAGRRPRHPRRAARVAARPTRRSSTPS